MSRAASRVALGSASWGMPYGIAESGPPSDRELEDLIAGAAALGVDTLDTARAYGRAEARIGELLASRSEAWRVVTKLDAAVWSRGEPAQAVRARVEASLQTSLENLRATRLDTLLVHRAAHRHACDGVIWDALRAERGAGCIGRLGLSAASPEEALAALEDEEVEVLQVAASLVDQRLVRAGFFERAAELGKELHVRSVFLQGAVHMSPESLPLVLRPLAPTLVRLRAFVGEQGCPLAAPFLGYANALPATKLVLGCESRDQLEENLRCAELLDSARLHEAERLVEELPDAVLDPWRWS